jgi:hypothetical protein
MVDGVTYTATFPTEDEAREWLVVTRGRVVGVRAARTLTVEAYSRRWLGEFIDTAAGLDRYRHHVEEHISRALGPRPPVEISATEISALLQHVNASASLAEAEQLEATLRELFADAVDDGIVARGPGPVPARSSL